MNVELMHYRFKLAVNNIDSENYRDLPIPAIDLYLNDAQNTIVTALVAQYNMSTIFRDSLLPLVEDINITSSVSASGPGQVDVQRFNLPDTFRDYISANITASNGSCSKEIELDYFPTKDHRKTTEGYMPSYGWGQAFYSLSDGVVNVYTREFTASNLDLRFVRNPQYIHYAAGTSSGSYDLGSGGTLSGISNSELPEQIHGDIVRLAAQMATGNLVSDKYQIQKDLFVSLTSTNT